jgi:hypothetical protein
LPSFTSQIPNLQSVGPIVELQIAVGTPVQNALVATGHAVPLPVRAVAMVDTGATGTVVQRGLLAPLQLNPVGATHINTPSSTNVACYEHSVRLLFPSKVLVEGITVIEAPLQGQHIQCLIGRDILAHGVLVYIGYSNLFSLSF